MRFYESAWLKKWIDKNTELRTAATNEFQKDFFIKLVTSKQKGEKLAAQPNFKHCTIFDENLVGIEMGKTKIEYNKPIYLAHAFLI